jgi:hypothetical protein
MKDFYDVWFLANHVSFELQELVEAVKATFERRKTRLPEEPILFQSSFIGSSIKQERWSNFCRLNKLNTELEFAQMVLKLDSFLTTIFQVLRAEEISFARWMPDLWIWKH